MLYLVLGVICGLVAAYSIVTVSPGFDQRTIGIAILHGQDPSTRNLVYVLAVLGSVCLFLSLFLFMRGSPVESVPGPVSVSEGPVLWFVLFANLLLYFRHESPIFLTASGVLVYLAGLSWAIRIHGKDKLQENISWMLAALVFQGMIAAGALLGFHLQFGIKYFSIFSVALALLLWLTQSVLREAGGRVNALRLSHALLPLMFTPLSVIAANELQYTLASRFGYGVSALHLWLALFGVIVFAVMVRFHGASAARVGVDTAYTKARIEWLLVSRYIPLVLASSVAFAEYTSTISFFANRDFFHGGEEIVPVQQMLQFGSIPYIDFYPPHGFFDILPQLFYQVLNQGDFVESIAWGRGYALGWLPRMLTIVAMYWLLKEFLGYRSVFLILFLLPTYHMFHPYYVFLFIPLIAVDAQRNTFLRWLLFWFLIVLVFLWRIDFGITALVAGLFMLAGWFWQQGCSARIGRCLLAAAVVGGAAVLMFVLLSTSIEKSPVLVAQRVFQYIQVQTPLSALQHIIRQVDMAAVLQYVVFPIIGAVVAAHFLSVALRREQLTTRMLMLAFIAIASLVMAARSLNRHSHYEGAFLPYFFILLAALAPVVMFRFSRSVNALFFILVCVATYTFFPRSTSPFVQLFYRATLQQEYPYPAMSRSRVNLVSGAAPETRLKKESPRASEITSFLRFYLKGEETFYDFSNTPLLYALTEKRMPSFVLETFFHTSEGIQRDLIRDLNQLYKKDRLPVVLFGQLPVWNKLDQVDTAVRSYRVAEFIYRNYEPCAQVGDHDVWLAKSRVSGASCLDNLRDALSGSALATGLAASPLAEPLQQFDVMKLPYVWANHDEVIAKSSCSTSRNIEVSSSANPDARVYQLALPEQVKDEGGNYLHMQLRSKHDARARVSYANDNSFEFDVLASPEPLDYLIRVSSQYAWYRGGVDGMHLTVDDTVELVCAAILPGD